MSGVSGSNGSVVLSALEFDMLWEVERLPRRHVALDVPSPGKTHGERADLVQGAWDSLSRRGLARRGRASGELVDMLNLFARPQLAIDLWIWAGAQISGLAVKVGGQAMLGVFDEGQVWLIPARESSLAEAAVSVAGQLTPGVGSSVSVPHEVLRTADSSAEGEPKALITSLEDRGVELWQAQELAGMLSGQLARGQFGVQRTFRDGQIRRAGKVVAYYDTDAGRYLLQIATNPDGQDWATVAPAGNDLIAERIRELTELV